MNILRTLSPAVFSFLTRYLPVVALIGLELLLPGILQGVAVRYQRHKAGLDRAYFANIGQLN